MKRDRLTVIAPIVFLMLALCAGATFADPGAGEGDVFLPLTVAGAGKVPGCDLPQSDFGTLSVFGSPQQGDPERSPDMNLGFRGYAPTAAALKLVTIDGSGKDAKAPQLPGMFKDKRTPRFSGAYQRYRWDYACNCRRDTYSPWDATVLGLGVKPGEIIYTPDSGYDIGAGYEYQVTYAGDSGITLYVGRDDDYHGYVIHIEDVCVDPDLVELYRRLHDRGREELPALRGHQPFGRALGGEIKVAVRDAGHFLDPRSRLDWWRGR